MIKYRKISSLTDEEVNFVIKDMFPYNARVDNIKRDEKWNTITCDLDISGHIETFMLNELKIITQSLTLTDEQKLKWKQFLIAKGCNYLFRDNPYMEM